MRHLHFLACLLALAACTKRVVVEAPLLPVPQYELDMVETVYGSTSYGDFNTQLTFDRDNNGLMAVLSRLDGLLVEFDVNAEFFPYSTNLPSYLVLTPRTSWTWTAYAPPDPNSYPTLLLDCYLYTQGGTVWPPSGFDNFAQSNPVWPLMFFRVW